MQTATVERRKIVTKIPADPAKAARFDPNRPLRVAAYCRVSTDLDDQLNSYETQKAYYTEYIRKNPKWRFAGIYADEGISGTQVKKRESFLRMISDCENGKIDLILIKSVSRYARNIVDCISYIRILKSLGIAIYFEEQNINTLTEDSETYIGIYGVLAQAESENISANIKWGIRKRMESGSYNCNFNLLGYRRDKVTKEIVIIPEEANAVKKIYSLYIQGNTLEQIKEYLESRQIKTSRGKYEWSKAGIKAILTNEKYVGDILYQKSFHPNLISKKVIRNCGEMDRYMVSNNHPAIIDRETAWLAKKEMSKRSSKRRSSENCITELGKYSGKYALSELLFCGVCGSPFRRKTWTRNGVKKIYWRCLYHMEKGNDACPQSKGIEEHILHAAICRGLTKSIPCENDVRNTVKTLLAYSLSDNRLLLEYRSLENMINELKAKAETAEKMCLATGGNKDLYIEEIKTCYASLADVRNQMGKLKAQIDKSPEYKTELEKIEACISDEEIGFTEYNDEIIRYLVSSITVTEDMKIIITLKGGVKITEPIYA